MLTFNCQNCKKDFQTNKATKKRIPKYCSSLCYGISLRNDRKCIVCGEHVTWTNKFFCSMICNAKYKKGKSFTDEHKKSLSLAKIGKPILHLYTPEILKKIGDSLRGKPQPWMRGKKHPNYINGGINHNERLQAMGRTEYKEWRRNVFKRDNFTCVHCGKNGVRLHADHIKPWALFVDLRYDLNNGRTLCVSCHMQTDTWGGIRKNGKKAIGKTESKT